MKPYMKSVMKPYMLAIAVGSALLIPQVSRADPPEAPGRSSAERTARPIPKAARQVASPAVSWANVVTCYTCGGNYPNYVSTGSLNGHGNMVYEFGSGCTGGWDGAPKWVQDNTPYFCANHPD